MATQQGPPSLLGCTAPPLSVQAPAPYLACSHSAVPWLWESKRMTLSHRSPHFLLTTHSYEIPNSMCALVTSIHMPGSLPWSGLCAGSIAPQWLLHCRGASSGYSSEMDWAMREKEREKERNSGCARLCGTTASASAMRLTNEMSGGHSRQDLRPKTTKSKHRCSHSKCCYWPYSPCTPLTGIHV